MADVWFHRCALITGASSGLGAEFARQLAPVCETLVLVARRETVLEGLAEALRAAHPGLAVGVIAADLTEAEARAGLMDELGRAELWPDLLVNNAGMGDHGEFAAAEWPKIEAMLRLNVEAMTAMAHLLVPGMIARGGGSVINVSSLACLLPIPDFAVYAASKAYVTSFSEAIRLELREHGIRVTALCPGPVHTEFGEVAGRGANDSGSSFREHFYVDAGQVVAEALAGLARDRARVFPGWKIAAAAALLAVVPIALTRRLMSSRPRRG
jgi:short-subunit dehydrogenase